MRWRLLAAAVGVTAPCVLPGTAWADDVVDRGRDRTTTESTEDCGTFTLDVVEHFDGRFVIRTAPDDPLGQAFLAQNDVRITTEATNARTGRSFTARFDGGFEELGARLVSHSPKSAVYDFRQRETARLVVRGDSGGPVIRERVELAHVQRFDTLGDGSDGAPGGTSISVDTTVVRGADFDDPDLCELGATLTT